MPASLVLCLAAPGCAARAPAGARPDLAAIAPACAAGDSVRIRTELFLGLATPTGSVSEDEWEAFLRDVVTPRFPDGLTVLRAEGQWRGAGGRIVREPSRVLVLIHPATARAGAAIAEIVERYRSAFRQEAVLRQTSLVCVRF